LDTLLFDSLLKLGLALILGAVVGLERGLHGRPAGLRTHALVCLASTLLILVSRTGALASLDSQVSGPFVFNVDPARMGAGIVTGIGFLGAGAILRIRESLIRGLTTAACIWFVAAVGIAVGFDHYLLAIAAAMSALIVLVVLDRVENVMARITYRTLTIRADQKHTADVEKNCRALIEKYKMKIQNFSYEADNREAEVKIVFFVRLNARTDTTDFISEFSKQVGLIRFKWF
jgi:putative Mg2+ transporter-C (MgtC) family protein